MADDYLINFKVSGSQEGASSVATVDDRLANLTATGASQSPVEEYLRDEHPLLTPREKAILQRATRK